ncbi:MazG nucleotide pyrophosphohydrolase domain-containing protein [Shouchella clausii]|uniref:NTP pyrophosphohydrolase MazG-like domain-containing protein n=1 Tax=Shouchella clausii TaxID=79880 RepID=A0A268RUU5_SHOCL|nr:MazG-like family protein [Shouchella clausii]PAD40922.1 hypothetical protein CHH54_19835 [Bacillus sp. 7520-S]AST96428.1 hypothetical protein BC8716_10915 [Shouchella clausii]MBU8596403.1 MazG-like family protein [Shouchella clausii]MCY1104062.1 MazG-like family protein [Shouchella clausii]MEB5471365.1 MazG-like family protein [Shouchella clausii]
MNSNDFQNWVANYYEKRGWADLGIFIRMGFLSEETGELARAIRALEIGRDRPDETVATIEENRRQLAEELGDVLGNISMIASHYDLTLEDVFAAHQKKLSRRYAQSL